MILTRMGVIAASKPAVVVTYTYTVYYYLEFVPSSIPEDGTGIYYSINNNGDNLLIDFNENNNCTGYYTIDNISAGSTLYIGAKEDTTPIYYGVSTAECYGGGGGNEFDYGGTEDVPCTNVYNVINVSSNETLYIYVASYEDKFGSQFYYCEP